MQRLSSSVSASTSAPKTSESFASGSIDFCLAATSESVRINVDLIRSVLSEYRIRSVPLEDCASAEAFQFSSNLKLVLLSIDRGLPDDPRTLDAIRHWRETGFKIICCGDHLDQLPLTQRCRILLTGALAIVDSAALKFAEELRSLLSQLFTLEATRRQEKETLKLQMKSLGVVGESDAMISIFDWLVRVSPLSDLPVLITGETGTGKDLLVNALWQMDPKRFKGPFITVNCCAISPGLVESELFGHTRGAFTGADKARKGLFRSANGGVIFLDEIGDLDFILQAKLLRVLQENRVLGVGEDREAPLTARVIAATNRNLEEMVREGKFRADLFHRLDILSIHVPSLRQRPEDLQPLIEHFLKKYRSLSRMGNFSVHPEVIEALSSVGLPGNARQLENLVRRVLLNKDSDGPIRLNDLAPDIWRDFLDLNANEKRTADQSPLGNGDASSDYGARDDLHNQLIHILDRHGWNLSQSLEYCERLLVESALKRTGGKQSNAAKLLGITPRTVYTKIRKHHLLQFSDKACD